ncbi:hypothetical protein NG895_03595 [Aeoliella sp. ICT_H6.2]|uniref:Uncharacterized protein n=1 Tax=Aeoliella straminimaris TaxID=2954799 RepID=A0A9X2FBF0_9BACT|nr:hypothetical protein [Aeoliella straminimaris]MCO6042981.1 hypothetical protein [Aeoliella straminimaris]
MSNSPHTTLEKLTKKDCGIRVDFYWLGDRFSHTISAVRDGEATVVWRSVDNDEFGPVYQELHEQTTHDGRTILFLNGASAGAHWSASVSFKEAVCHLTFDVAARVAKEPVERVIEYRSELDGNLPLACAHFANGSGELIDPSPPGNRIPSEESSDKLPATLRYKYMFLW